MPLKLHRRHEVLTVTNATWRLLLEPDFRPAADIQSWHLLHSGPHSRIYRTRGDSPCVAKLAVPRSQPRDTLRKYINCQARREFHGNRVLQDIGLRTPRVYGWGMTLSPLAQFESVLFMQPLPECISALTLIRQETDRDNRHDFLKSFAEQLACLQGRGYIHKDAHFGNLCVLDDGALMWIDNDIRQPLGIAARRRGLGKTLRLLESTARKDITPPEWEFFRHRLRRCLARWPQGEQLAHEV